jgi:hypothetical protein
MKLKKKKILVIEVNIKPEKGKYKILFQLKLDSLN